MNNLFLDETFFLPSIYVHLDTRELAACARVNRASRGSVSAILAAWYPGFVKEVQFISLQPGCEELASKCAILLSNTPQILALQDSQRRFTATRLEFMCDALFNNKSLERPPANPLSRENPKGPVHLSVLPFRRVQELCKVIFFNSLYYAPGGTRDSIPRPDQLWGRRVMLHPSDYKFFHLALQRALDMKSRIMRLDPPPPLDPPGKALVRDLKRRCGYYPDPETTADLAKRWLYSAEAKKDLLGIDWLEQPPEEVAAIAQLMALDMPSFFQEFLNLLFQKRRIEQQSPDSIDRFVETAHILDHGTSRQIFEHFVEGGRHDHALETARMMINSKEKKHRGNNNERDYALQSLAHSLCSDPNTQNLAKQILELISDKELRISSLKEFFPPPDEHKEPERPAIKPPPVPPEIRQSRQHWEQAMRAFKRHDDRRALEALDQVESRFVLLQDEEVEDALALISTIPDRNRQEAFLTNLSKIALDDRKFLRAARIMHNMPDVRRRNTCLWDIAKGAAANGDARGALQAAREITPAGIRNIFAMLIHNNRIDEGIDVLSKVLPGPARDEIIQLIVDFLVESTHFEPAGRVAQLTEQPERRAAQLDAIGFAQAMLMSMEYS